VGQTNIENSALLFKDFEILGNNVYSVKCEEFFYYKINRLMLTFGVAFSKYL
jgi:hypothetical protein